MSATEGVFAEHSRQLNREAELHTKKNMALAYDRKIEEFKLYSRHSFRHLDFNVQETVIMEEATHLHADQIPLKVLNWSQMANYSNAILKLLQFQRDMGANKNFIEEDLYNYN
jgi:hypothetical protein